MLRTQVTANKKMIEDGMWMLGIQETVYKLAKSSSIRWYRNVLR